MTSNKSFIPRAHVAVDASGAVKAASQGNIVVIVDVIDMSTTLETCLEKGAVGVFGVSAVNNRAPVKTDPEKVVEAAVLLARKYLNKIIVVSEPRTGGLNERLKYSSHVLKILKENNVTVEKIIPNLGKEVADLAKYEGRIVLAVTDSGGTAFDAAFTAGAKVCTATVARTINSKGTQPAEKGVIRALTLAKRYRRHIAYVAASSNSLEDVLAARYLAGLSHLMLRS